MQTISDHEQCIMFTIHIVERFVWGLYGRGQQLNTGNVKHIGVVYGLCVSSTLTPWWIHHRLQWGQRRCPLPSLPIIIFTTLLLLFEDYVFLNLKEVITIIALKANLFLEHAKQMGLPFLNICDILIDLGVQWGYHSNHHIGVTISSWTRRSKWVYRFPIFASAVRRLFQGQMVLSNNSNKITQLEVLCPSGDREIFLFRNGDKHEYSDKYSIIFSDIYWCVFTCDLKSADDTTSNWRLGASVTCVSVCKRGLRGDLTWTLRKGQLGLTSCRSIVPSACCSPVVFHEKLVWQSNLINTNSSGATIIAIAHCTGL